MTFALLGTFATLSVLLLLLSVASHTSGGGEAQMVEKLWRKKSSGANNWNALGATQFPRTNNNSTVHTAKAIRQQQPQQKEFTLLTTETTTTTDRCPLTTAEVLRSLASSSTSCFSNHTSLSPPPSWPGTTVGGVEDELVAKGVAELLAFPGLVTQLLAYDKKVIAKLLRERPLLWKSYLQPTTTTSTSLPNMSNSFDKKRLSPTFVEQCKEDTPECLMFSNSFHTRSPFYVVPTDGGRRRVKTTAQHQRGSNISLLLQDEEEVEGAKQRRRGKLTTISEARRLFGRKNNNMETKLSSNVEQKKNANDDEEGDIAATESFLFAKCCAEHSALRRALVCWEDVQQQFFQEHPSPTNMKAMWKGNIDSTEEEATAAASSKDDRPRLPWWLAFGSLLGPIRNAAYTFVNSDETTAASNDHHCSSAGTAGEESGTSAPHQFTHYSTVIPWDTDLDVMIEPSTPFSDFVTKLFSSRGSSWKTSIVGRRQQQCHAILAPENQQHHVHGDLLGFVFASPKRYDAEKNDKDGDQSSPIQTQRAKDVPTSNRDNNKKEPLDPSQLCPDNSCSRVEVWLRNEAKKTQRRNLIFPLQLHDGGGGGGASNKKRSTADVFLSSFALYGEHPIQIPRLPVEVLRQGYGDSWCRPCKHRTSACKNVSV